ncbi:CPBP family intramembrane glutamic endopeptidase [Ferruginibacter yonginensis]|uniref:CPBP family intramembrane glutamic endopeptidase n=1 Tax=Ferruginibacter yonginensis TaxID=1310416 RepID=A0ABV8QRJ4_9BACT
MNQRSTILLKVVLFTIIFIVLFIGLCFLKNNIPSQYERLAHGLIGTLAALLTSAAFIKFDGISFNAIGLRWEHATIPRFLIGILVAATIMGGLTILVIALQGLTITKNENNNGIYFLLNALPLLPLAFMEEVAFRGYTLQTLKQKFTTPIAIIFTAFLFAVYHVVNGWSLQNAFMGAGCWGLVFGVSAVYSNGIAMPTGLHVAANFITSLFGTTAQGVHLFHLQSHNSNNINDLQTSTLLTVIPQIIVLLIGMVGIVWVNKKQPIK